MGFQRRFPRNPSRSKGTSRRAPSAESRGQVGAHREFDALLELRREAAQCKKSLEDEDAEWSGDAIQCRWSVNVGCRRAD